MTINTDFYAEILRGSKSEKICQICPICGQKRIFSSALLYVLVKAIQQFTIVKLFLFN